MHLGIIRVSERCRLGIWFLATRRAGRRAAGQAAPIQLLIGSVARSCWCSSTSSFSRFKRDAPALLVLNTASGFLRSRSIVGQKATAMAPRAPLQALRGRHRPSGARPRKVGKRSNPFVRVRWCGCLISVRLDRCCRRGRMTGCHPERPVVVSRANRSRRPQAVIQVSLKNGPVMPHIRVFRRWMRGIIWISSTVHAFRVCKACRAGSRLVAASGRAISCVCQDWFQGRLQAIIICSHARRGLVRVPRAALRVTRDRASRFNPVPLRPGQEAR
jgi:hypothetical protein